MENQWNSQSTLCENIFTWPHRQDIETPNVLALLGDLKGKTVLDFGCGPGNYSRLMKLSGAAKVVGYDISEGMLKCARDREETENLGIDYVSSLTPDLNGHFDLVLNAFVLPYAPTRSELHTLCSDMARVLRPGGRLVVVTVNPDYDINTNRYDAFGLRYISEAHHVDGEKLILEIRRPPHLHQFKVCYWSKSSLETALMDAEFCKIEWKKAMLYGPCPVEDAPDFIREYLERPRFAMLECFLPQ